MGADQPCLSAKINGHELKIYPDYDCESPREWDNLGTIVYSHRHYTLGDVSAENISDYDDWDEWFAGEILSLHGKYNVIYYPIYLYDHSGLTISIKPFGCRWDSGQIGFIYVTKQKLYETFGVKRLTKKYIDVAYDALRSEIDTYDKFLRGDVYGFVYEKEIVCDACDHIANEHIDSCWGFYGSDWETNGMTEHLPEEAIPLLKELCEC